MDIDDLARLIREYCPEIGLIEKDEAPLEETLQSILPSWEIIVASYKLPTHRTNKGYLHELYMEL